MRWLNNLGLQGFTLFKNPSMALFFMFVMLLGAALQITSAYSDITNMKNKAMLGFLNSIKPCKPRLLIHDPPTPLPSGGDFGSVKLNIASKNDAIAAT